MSLIITVIVTNVKQDSTTLDVFARASTRNSKFFASRREMYYRKVIEFKSTCHAGGL